MCCASLSRCALMHQNNLEVCGWLRAFEHVYVGDRVTRLFPKITINKRVQFENGKKFEALLIFSTDKNIAIKCVHSSRYSLFL